MYTKRNTEYTHLVNLALMPFVFPRLCIDVVQFCSKFASCYFAEKAKLRQPQSTFNRKSDCWRYAHVTTLGRTSSLLPPGAENPSYATAIRVGSDDLE